MPALRKLAGPYHRALRRIAGCVRHSSDSNVSDYDVRAQLGLPSIDSLVMQKRLVYIGRVLAHRPAQLIALLASSKKLPDGNVQRLPWVCQLIDDFSLLHRISSHARRILPSPDTIDNQHCWFSFIREKRSEWTTMVKAVSFIESVWDTHVQEVHPSECDRLAYVCHMCSNAVKPAFATMKALGQHQRIKHQIRTEVRNYVDDSGFCPVCSTNFQSRIRVIAHLSDTRPSRCKCRDEVLSGRYEQLPGHVVVQLDGVDKQLKRDARRAGSSHVIACRTAVTDTGRRVGHVTG